MPMQLLNSNQFSQQHQLWLCGSQQSICSSIHRCQALQPAATPDRMHILQKAWFQRGFAPTAINQRGVHAGPGSLLSCKATAAEAVAKSTGAADKTHTAAPSALNDATEAQQQWLDILEWPAVCKQVAAFCGTSMAAELLLAGQLPIGRSQQESELLLQQTQEASDAQLQVAGVFDLRPALAAAVAGGVLNARQLEGVASSMEAAFHLRDTVGASATDSTPQQSLLEQQRQQQHKGKKRHEDKQQQQQQQWPCLADLAAGIKDNELALLRAIRGCISDGTVLSQASPELAAVRTARQANKEAARSLVTQIARKLHAEGAAEGKEPLMLRGRYCVAVRTNRRSALSKGSVRLGASGTGATLYMEPAEILDLNNKEALLAEQEQEQEIRVMQTLSMLLAQRSAAVQAMLDAVTALDIVAARAKHAAWLSAVRPCFNSSSSSSSSGISPMYLPGARHPLLMQAALPPLPRPPSIDDAAFESDFIPPPIWAMTADSSTDSDSDDDMLNPSSGSGLRPMPKPLDLQVPSDVRVVAVTGPNTGGKTVTLKTAGLCALMAKAGLFVPVDQELLAAAAAAAAAAVASSETNSSSSSSSQPRLLWFDQVLADIGDAQSLQQNLSTFSGHIQRLKLLLAAAGPGSLVLLDEVGSGTDPQEGAALARAVLDTLAGQARLTLATSHHAELKGAADEDSRYVNVSMEFNTLTLRPTYKLCWGSAGSSNALDIAQSLGFDSRVLQEARILARAEMGVREKQAKMEKVAASVEGQIASARESLAALNAARQKQEQQLQRIEGLTREVMKQRARFKHQGMGNLVDKEQADMLMKIQTAARQVRKQQKDVADVQAVIDTYLQKIHPKSSSSSSSSTGGTAAAGHVTGAADMFQPGDKVYVPEGLSGIQLQSLVVQVVKVDGDYVWVDTPTGLSSMFMPGVRSKSTLRGFKVHRDKVIREDLVIEMQKQAQQALQGLEGYDAQQAQHDQQLNQSVASALDGSSGGAAAG